MIRRIGQIRAVGIWINGGKKMKKYISTILLGMALLSVSCVKEDNRIGNLIRFSAATEFQNGVETRTLYSGDDNINIGGNRYERINWISGDDMYILYKHGSSSDNAIYNVSTISSPSGNKKSTAQVTLASGSTALEWADGTPVFYGVYPATVSSGTAPTVNASGVVSNLSIPVTQTVEYNSTQGKYLPDMRKAYMVSYASSGQISGETVTLPFTPVVTALEFKLKLKENATSQDVKQVQLQSSSSLAGNYSVNITGYANDAVTWTMGSTSSTSNHVTVSFKNGNTVTEPGLSYSNYLNFTVFVLPVANVSGLSLLIKYHDDTVKELSLSGLTLLAGQKYIITNSKVPNLDYDYYITPISDITLAAGHTGGYQDITVESYKQDKTDASNKKPVPWKMQYSADNGTTWTDLPSGGYQNFTASVRSHNTGGVPGSGQTPRMTLSGTASSTTKIDPAGLDAVTAVGSASNPIDLSMTSGSRNTANCYIVTGPGFYMFPCVYGNAIKNGSTNTSAFHPAGASDNVTEASGSSVTTLSGVNTTYNVDNNVDVYYLPHFQNVSAGNINSEYIVSDLNIGTAWTPYVVWQDVPQGQEIIPYDAEHIGKMTVSNRDFIWFKIDADKIKPGNLLIAMRGNSGGYILWSWHIWIPGTSAPSASGNFMDRNLGEVVQNQVTQYADRSMKFRILQTETGGTSEEFTFTQNGDQSSPTNLATRNTYYQWGRKDPELNTNSASYVSLNPNLGITRANCFTSFQGFQFDANSIDCARAIRAPYYLFNNDKTSSWMDGDAYPFLASYGAANTYNYSNPNQKVDFTFEQAVNLNGTSFSSPTDWIVYEPGYWYVPLDHSIKRETYSLTEVQWLTWDEFNGTTGSISSANPTNPYKCLSVSDFGPLDYPNNTKWKYNGNTRGPFNATQTIYLNSLGFNNGSATGTYIAPDWVYYNDGQRHAHFIGTYNTGPYSQQDLDIMIQNGFVANDFTIASTQVSEVTHTASERQASSIPYNLWNSYLYSENPHCTSANLHDVNKFKTILDPCPPGYTVPTRNELNISSGYPARGSHPGTSQDGYWTDHACSMKATSNNGDLRTQWSNFYDYDKAFWKISGTTNAKATRSTAASIRPMVDPKLSGVATSLSPAAVSGNSIEGVTNGSNLY